MSVVFLIQTSSQNLLRLSQTCVEVVDSVVEERKHAWPKTRAVLGNVQERSLGLRTGERLQGCSIRAGVCVSMILILASVW